MRVVFASTAEADLEEIGDHIAMDNARRAVTFVRALRARAQAIGSSPRAYPLVPRFEHHGVRRRVHRGYLIFYRIEDDRVAIVHVLHGARDFASVLFPQA